MTWCVSRCADLLPEPYTSPSLSLSLSLSLPLSDVHETIARSFARRSSSPAVPFLARQGNSVFYLVYALESGE
jgi:hypothetical protein